MPIAYRNPILRRGQEEVFRGFAPTIEEFREIGERGFTVLKTDIGQVPKDFLGKFWWKFQHGFSTQPIEAYTAGMTPEGLFYTASREGRKISAHGLDIVNPVSLAEQRILPYGRGRGSKVLSSGWALQQIESGKFDPKKGYLKQFSRPYGFPVSWAGGKREISTWLEWGETNKRFLPSARKAFGWTRAHTIESVNLGETYQRLGKAEGRKFLEKKFGQSFDKLVFRHTLSGQSKGVWLGLGGLEGSQSLAFTGRTDAQLLALDKGYRYPIIPKASEWSGERVVKKFGERSTTLATRQLKQDLFQGKIQVSKLEKLAGEYRVVFAGGEMVGATHRWGPPGIKEFFQKRPKLGRIFESVGIKSGTPEMMFPVIGGERELLGKFTKKYLRTFTTGAGGLDVARVSGKKGMDALRVVELQKHPGDISRPGVMGAIESRLTGKWSMGRKVAVGAGAAAIAGAILLPKIYNKIVDRNPEREYAQKNLIKAVRNKNTAGLTNKVMYEKRTQHQIIDTREKTKHLFRI